MSIIELIGQPRELGHTGRKSQKPDFFSDALDWKIYRAAKVPGPGAYETRRSYTSMAGGRWGKSETRSYIDWVQSHAKDLPGPGQYNVDEAFKSLEAGHSGGGKFNMGNSKTYLDLVVYQSRNNPGPAQYELPNMHKTGGGKFNMSRPKTDVEWRILLASKMPAPGQYGSGLLDPPTGGKFNTSKTKSDIDWAISRASKTPGPGQYAIAQQDSLGRVSGGKFNMGHSKSDVDWAIYRGQRTPGPGNYDVERSARYLSGSPKFSFAGRPGPSNMPNPYAEFSVLNASRASRSGSPTGEGEAGDGKTSPVSRSMSADPSSLERANDRTQRHLERMKTAYQQAAVKRRQRNTLGYGRSFFL